MALQFYGGDILVVGVTSENLTRLQEGRPIFFEVLRPIRGLALLYGATKEAIAEELRKHGFPVPEMDFREGPDAPAPPARPPDLENQVTFIDASGVVQPYDQRAAQHAMNEIFEKGTLRVAISEDPATSQMAVQVFADPHDEAITQALIDTLEQALATFRLALEDQGTRKPS